MPDKSSLPSIQFHFLQKSADPKQRRRLKAFILLLFKKEKASITSLNLIFCSDKYLLEINQQFLQHNFYTDIISFNLAANNKTVEGEIYISLDRVRENAGELNLPFKTELHRVIFHGALHLCGFKDKRQADIRLMRKKENEYLKSYFK